MICYSLGLKLSLTAVALLATADAIQRKEINGLEGLPLHESKGHRWNRQRPQGPLIKGEMVYWSYKKDWYGTTDDNRQVKLLKNRKYQYRGGDVETCRLATNNEVLTVTRPPDSVWGSAASGGVRPWMPIHLSRLNILEATGAIVRNRLGPPDTVLVRGNHKVLRYAAPEVEKQTRSGTVVRQVDEINTTDNRTATSRKTVKTGIYKWDRNTPYYFEVTVDKDDRVIGVRDLLIP